jgi:hypothetical protein
MALHPVLDLDHWCRVAPFPPLRRWWRRWHREPEPPEIVCSPLDVAAIEQCRRTRPSEGRTTPADWFVWNTAPPVQPFLTKLGGVPHREATVAWPTDEKGQPRTFLGQFCFLDSLDIVGDDLPGDVLLIFGTGGAHIDLDDFHLEWARAELRRPASSTDVPRPRVCVPALSGVRHRTVEDHARPTQGSKIGTTTLFIQRAATGEDDLLCALSCFWARPRWPTVDRERLGRAERRELGALPLGDAGCIYVERSHGEFFADADCY